MRDWFGQLNTSFVNKYRWIRHKRKIGEVKEGATNRGFGIVEFKDRNGNECSLQKSSIATEECVWLGCDEIGLKRFTPKVGWQDVELEQDHPYGITHVANNRMHLNQVQVKALLPYLQHFAETGELPKSNETITVCSACLQSSCWQGKFYCDEYQTAGTVEKTRSELEALALEHPDNWTREPL
jgi:hypothetical protein